MSGASKPSRTDIEAWLTKEVAEALEAAAADIDVDRNFLELGISSRGVVGISGRLQKWLGTRLSPAIFFEYSTIRSLAAHLAGESAESGLLSGRENM
ncbi:MAG: acyl carrier protein [Myxococcota bacterium]